MKVTQLFLTLCNPKDYIVPGILHARILEWVAFAWLDLPKPGIEPGLPALQTDALLSEPPGRPLVWPQVNNREGTQPHPSTENWITDLLSMALHTRARPSFPHSWSFPSGSFHKPFILLHQREDRMKTTITEKLTNLITWITALSNSMML